MVDLKKLREQLYELDEKARNDPEKRKRGEELYRKLSTLTEEDLRKRMTI